MLSVELLSDTAENGRLPVRLAFDVNGVGRWEQEVSISMPDAATLEKIRERGKVHAAIHGGRVVTRGMVEAVTATDKLSPRAIEAALKLYFPSGPKPRHLAASTRSRRQPIR